MDKMPVLADRLARPRQVDEDAAEGTAKAVVIVVADADPVPTQT